MYGIVTAAHTPTCAWIRADRCRQDGAICSKNRKIVPYHRCARILRLTVSIPDYGSWMHSKRIPKFSKTFTGIFTVPFSFGPEISEFLVEWKAPKNDSVTGNHSRLDAPVWNVIGQWEMVHLKSRVEMVTSRKHSWFQVNKKVTRRQEWLSTFNPANETKIMIWRYLRAVRPNFQPCYFYSSTPLSRMQVKKPYSVW